MTDISTQNDRWSKWSDEKPADLQPGRLLLWRTEHKRLGLRMSMSGPLRRMCNGWNDTYHILPTMTRWDGYRHIIPSDLEWSDDVPSWIEEEATWSRKNIYGRTESGVTEHKLRQLLVIDGIYPRPCPFCGGSARWDSRDGFIGAMPHQENEFSVGHCLRTPFFTNPQKAADFWNRRAPHVEEGGAA